MKCTEVCILGCSYVRYVTSQCYDHKTFAHIAPYGGFSQIRSRVLYSSYIYICAPFDRKRAIRVKN